MVANLILLCSLKHISLVWNLKNFYKKTWAILFICLFFFQTGIWVPIVFNISDTCPFFQYSLFFFYFFILFYEWLLYSPCLSFCNWNFLRETFTITWSIYPIKHIFVSIPSVGVEHFWMDKNMFLRTPSIGAADIWSVRDLDLESMISFSTMVTRFDQTQYNDK